MPHPVAPGSIYLCAPINALVEGIYEEGIPFGEVLRHGDFGIGTFDHLDGEMVMLDRQIFQIRDDGKVEEVHESALTPFACVTHFNAHRSVDIPKPHSYRELQDHLLAILPSPNIFYAFRIDGQFSQIRVRSVPRQDSYHPLVEVTAHQPEFEFQDIAGSLVGFYTPDFMSSLSVPGFHLHFISNDRRHGGHLLDFSSTELQVGIQALHQVNLALPTTEAYLHADFHRDITDDLNQAEH